MSFELRFRDGKPWPSPLSPRAAKQHRACSHTREAHRCFTSLAPLPQQFLPAGAVATLAECEFGPFAIFGEFMLSTISTFAGADETLANELSSLQLDDAMRAFDFSKLKELGDYDDNDRIPHVSLSRIRVQLRALYKKTGGCMLQAFDPRKSAGDALF